jgi:hypothetical protein
LIAFAALPADAAACLFRPFRQQEFPEFSNGLVASFAASSVEFRGVLEFIA